MISLPNIWPISLFVFSLISVLPCLIGKPNTQVGIAVKAIAVERWHLETNMNLPINHRSAYSPPFAMNGKRILELKEFNALVISKIRHHARSNGRSDLSNVKTYGKKTAWEEGLYLLRLNFGEMSGREKRMMIAGIGTGP